LIFASKKAKKSRERGVQVDRSGIQGVPDADGILRYPISADKAAEYKRKRQEKNKHALDAKIIARLQDAAVADQLRHEAECAELRSRSKKWNEKGSNNSAFKRAIQINAQHTLRMNLTSYNALREGEEGIEKGAVGENPERTSIQRVLRTIEHGVCQLLHPEIDAMKVSFPLSRILREVIRLSGWDKHGVAADAAGKYDMTGAPLLGVGLSADGASLMASDLGCVIKAVKFTGYHISTTLAGHGAVCEGATSTLGGQAARACILTGFLLGGDR
jgi:hypothetical protein